MIIDRNVLAAQWTGDRDRASRFDWTLLWMCRGQTLNAWWWCVFALIGGAGGGGRGGGHGERDAFLFSGVQGGATLEIPCEPFAGVPVAGVPAYGFPIEDGSGVISATFCDPIYRSAFGKQHLGLDIAADEGKTVITTMAGRVIRSEFDNQFGMGWNLKVCDDAGWCFVYQHLMEQPMVNVNDGVGKGQQVGKVGNTGQSTNPHLHYRNRSAGRHRN